MRGAVTWVAAPAPAARLRAFSRLRLPPPPPPAPEARAGLRGGWVARARVRACGPGIKTQGQAILCCGARGRGINGMYTCACTGKEQEEVGCTRVHMERAVRWCTFAHRGEEARVCVQLCAHGRQLRCVCTCASKSRGASKGGNEEEI